MSKVENPSAGGIDLLPCPFCGGRKFHCNTRAKGYFLKKQMEREKKDTSNYLVRCTKCGAKGPLKHSAQEAAVAWNDRAKAQIEPKYLVWSNEHAAWWGKDRRGYARMIANAGRYSRAEALSIAGVRDGGWHVRKGNPDEIAIPEQDAIDQYADITRAQEHAA